MPLFKTFVTTGSTEAQLLLKMQVSVDSIHTSYKHARAAQGGGSHPLSFSKRGREGERKMRRKRKRRRRKEKEVKENEEGEEEENCKMHICIMT